MKLTETQIKFIDKYLKNSGVDYLDIRYEMTDHVATAIENKEGDFYDEFKAYMTENKRELLNSNNKFRRTARNKAIKLLFSNMLSTWGIILLGCLFGLSLLASAYIGIEMVSDILNSAYNLLMIGLGIAYFHANFFKKEKLWSVTDKLLGMLCLIMYLVVIVFKVPKLIGNNIYLLLYYSFIVSFVVMAAISFRQLSKKYRLRYNG